MKMHTKHKIYPNTRLVPSVAIYSETFCNIVYENAYTAQNLSETITITFNCDKKSAAFFISKRMRLNYRMNILLQNQSTVKHFFQINILLNN